MASIPYSHKSIEALPTPLPPRRQQEYGVAGHRGLLVIVSSTGTKAWYRRYQIRGQRRKMRLGIFPQMGLKAAAKAALAIQAKLDDGIDPMGEPPDEDGSFGELCGVYLKEVSKGQAKLAPRTLEERRRILGLSELRRLRAMHPAEIRDTDIARALDGFESRDALVMMNRVQLAVSAVFAWAVLRKRYGLESNPVRRMERRYQEAPRDRVLSADEIRIAWRDMEDRGPLTRVALRLVLLTGQRPGEVRRMRWEHVEGTKWTMPRGFRKATKADKGRPSKAHRVHLSAIAQSELQSLRAFERGGFVFPARTKEPHQEISRQSLARPVARMVARTEMERWTPHDLRRTARTGFVEVAKSDAVVAEKIVGHALPALLRVYDQGEQWDARVDVLKRWSDWIAEVTA